MDINKFSIQHFSSMQYRNTYRHKFSRRQPFESRGAEKIVQSREDDEIYPDDNVHSFSGYGAAKEVLRGPTSWDHFERRRVDAAHITSNKTEESD